MLRSRENIGAMLRHLVATQKSVQLYPRNHPSVRRNLYMLDTSVRTLLGSVSEIEVRVVANELFFRNESLSRETLDFAGFIDELNARRINTIVIRPGVELDELYKLTELLNESVDFWKSHSAKLATDLTDRGLVHVHIESGAILGAVSEGHGLVGGWKSDSVAVGEYMNVVDMMWQLGHDLIENKTVDLGAVTKSVRSIAHLMLEDEALCARLSMLKSFDDYTFNHSVNVSLISMMIGSELGLSRTKLNTLGVASMLHDVGKLAIPPDILNKPDRLTESEWHIIHDHPKQGARLVLEQAAADDISVTVAFEHHAGYGGGGYPTLVSGKRQHLFSRIVAIADVFDALSSPRAYRTQLSPAKALKYIVNGSGSSFDPLLVKVLFRITGLYPVGTAVQFNTGSTGLVYSTNRADPARPVVRLAYDATGNPIGPELIDMSAVPASDIWIENTLSPASLSLEPVMR